MILLCFAHRAEAEAFFVEKDFCPDNRLKNFYKSSSGEEFLLITGEGPYSALSKISSVLSFEKTISKIINLGTAGALGNQYEKLDVFSIRTAYLAESSEALPQFKSFPLQVLEGLPKIDCITSTQRIKDPRLKHHLSSFADVVDRELWSIGFAAKESKIPLFAIKIISDATEDLNFCQDVKNSSFKLSSLLFQAYMKLFTNEKQNTKDELFERVVTLSDFYFSTSQKRSLKKYLTETEITWTELERLIKKIHIEENNKANAKKLLETLSEFSSPEFHKLRNKVKGFMEKLEKSGIRVSHDQTFESPSLKLTTDIKSLQDLNSKVQALQNFSYRDWEDFINGDL